MCEMQRDAGEASFGSCLVAGAARGCAKVIGLGRRGKDGAPHSDKDQGSSQMAAEERRGKKQGPSASAPYSCLMLSRCESHFLFSFLGCYKKRPIRGETTNNGRNHKKYFSHFQQRSVIQI